MTQDTRHATDGTHDLLAIGQGRPPRHVVMDLLRHAAGQLGVSRPLLATLDGLLSFLPPKRDHNVVFASNETLVDRLNGITERTLRRHVAQLVALGLIQRRDSANRKRFTRRSRAAGDVLRFGFDLTPVFARLSEIAECAAREQARREHVAYLRTRLRAGVQQRLSRDPEDPLALRLRPLLRRVLSAEFLEEALQRLEATTEENAEADTLPMSAGDGQNVRHHQNLNTDLKIVGSVEDIREACPGALEFALDTVRDPGDVMRHARLLAPMLGIDRSTYQDAEARLTPYRAAVTIWVLVQMMARLEQPVAYFVTLARSAKPDFAPLELLRRGIRETLDPMPDGVLPGLRAGLC